MNLKLTTVLLLLAVFQVSASSFAQQVTLKKDNISLAQLFKEIRKQTGYNFVLFESNIDANATVSVNYTNTPLTVVLDETLKDKALDYTIDKKTIVIKAAKKSILDKVIEYFKQIDVRGKVVDESGQPLIGATVRLKSGKQVTVADANGGFYFRNVDERDSVMISFTGYASLSLLAKPDLGTIQMKIGNEALKEVVVASGYQTTLKERTAGAISHVGQEVFANRPVSNISTALQGQIAGMQARENSDGTMTFLVRGVSTLSTNTNNTGPLLIVDGFPIAGNNFSAINPNDVESIDVLKDAAAAAIWGARSSNGVIVVTTKHGKGRNGLTIEGNVFTTISKKADLNQLLTTANSADMVAYEKYAFQNKLIYPSGVYTGGVFPTDLFRGITLAQELLYGNQYGQISTAAMNRGLDSLSNINNHDQISKYLLRRATIKQYNVSLNAVSDRSNTYASLLFENNQSRTRGNGFERYNINLRNEYKVNKFLTFNFGLFLQYQNQQNSGATNDELQSLSPYETLLNPDGSYSANVQTSRSRYTTSLLPLNKFPYADWSYNLLREVNGRDLNTKLYNARIQTGLEFKILPGLKFTSSLQYEHGKTDVNYYYSDDTYFVRNLVNSAVQYNNTTRTVSTVYLPKGGINQNGIADQNGVTGNPNVNSQGYIFRNQLNFTKDFGKHNITALATTEISQNRADNRVNPWQYGYNPATLRSTAPPYGYGSSVDQFYSYTSTIPTSTLQGGNTIVGYNLNRFVSGLAKADYTYDNRYVLSGTIRSDASNFVTKDPALRWSPFWSIGGAWLMRNEKFAQHLTWVDDLKLRATYGRNGAAVTTSSTNTLLNVATALSAISGTYTATISDNGNPTLRWEKTTQTDLAVDFSLFGHKLYGSLDWYNKKGSDILGTITLPGAAGTTSQVFNNAGISNHGIELELGTQGRIGSTGIAYTVNGNCAYNKNKVTNLYFTANYAYNFTADPSAFIEGYPANSVFSYIYAGMQNGLPMVKGADGTNYSMNSLYYLTAFVNAMKYQGTAIPPHIAGLRPSISYRNFSVTAQFEGQFGGVFRNPTFNYYSAFVGANKTPVNKWVSKVFAGDPSVPGFPAANSADFYIWQSYSPFLDTQVESSSYIQCTQLRLDYSLSKNMLKATQFRNVRAYVEANNLGLVWVANKNGYNPRWLPGTDRPVAYYTLGLNIGF